MTVDVSATQGPGGIVGKWVLNSHTPGKQLMDITYVRGFLTQVDAWEWDDPFGPKSLSLTFPSVTIFDKVGQGDLAGISKETNVDYAFIGTLPSIYPGGKFIWQGYMESFSYAADGLKVECKGALYQVDNYQAKPEYLQRPLPYEIAIARQINAWGIKREDLRTAPPRIVFPSWWATYYTPKAGTPGASIPLGVKKGDKWTGLVTRSTGTWEPALTSYIQTLLSTMYTARGRWTLDLLPGRVPILQHRDFTYEVQPGNLVIDPGSPGVEISVSQDYSQSLNCLYGNGKSLSGTSYSGMMVTPDGADTYYTPLAQLRQIDESNLNAWFDASLMKRETVLSIQPGLEEDDAQAVANGHLQHFSEPGLTGTITLSVDPVYVLTTTTNSKGKYIVATSTFLPRMVIKPGMTCLVPGLLGDSDGFLFHVASVSASPEDGTITLTIDNKYRDALTVSEVRLRGRDSLSIQRQLIGGQFQLPTNDQLVPWNYAQGSGYLPSSPHLSSVPLFRSMPATVKFPWTEWTTQRPPSAKHWRNCYVRIGPKSNLNSNNNWAVGVDRVGTSSGILVKVSQAATIRLIQMAAYDKDGYVLPVPFHVSFYYMLGTSYAAMPQIEAASKNKGGFLAGQHYPFFDYAWESYAADGTKVLTETPTSVSSAGLIRAFGTGYVPAGYWPGSKPAGDPPTGLLVDEGTMDIAVNQDNFIGGVNTQRKSQQPKYAGYILMMIYCDAQLSQEVFFAGRMFRTEPGDT